MIHVDQRPFLRCYYCGFKLTWSEAKGNASPPICACCAQPPEPVSVYRRAAIAIERAEVQYHGSRFPASDQPYWQDQVGCCDEL